MGSLISRFTASPSSPRAPAPIIIAAPAAAPSAPSLASIGKPAETTTDIAGSSEGARDTEVQAQRRENNLLDRRRGRSSTVLSSLRGALNQSTQPQRKTLLGE